MKVRILGNSIRYRLKQPEVNLFLEEGKVTELTEFGPGLTDRLSFCLEVTQEPELTVRFEFGNVIVGVPRDLAEEWVNTDLVGFDGSINTGKDRMIEVLVEKDFFCLDRPLEEQEGAYPNPNAIC